MSSNVMPLADTVTGRRPDTPGFDETTAEQLLGALEMPVMMLDARLTFLYVNPAAETVLARASGQLAGRPISRVLPDAEHVVQPVLELARDGGMKAAERGLRLNLPGRGACVVDLTAVPLGDGRLVVTLYETTVSHQVDRRMGFLGAAQTVTGMAAVLAHEIKNPLSGIRGASQLLERAIGESDKPLTELIRAEVDRVCGLVDRMTAFSSEGESLRSAVNIHEVLDRVEQLARTGFGSHVRFVTDYDPSLPPVSGNPDLLIQVFLNLVKNAAEACPLKNGEVRLTTAYRSGLDFTGPGDNVRRRLGIEVSIADNGDGIDPALRDRLFEPFVTSKSNGSGLGLSLTAKIISDLGGLIDCEAGKEGRGTVFRVLLPMHNGKLAEDGA